jgi:hypothetical protein
MNEEDFQITGITEVPTEENDDARMAEIASRTLVVAMRRVVQQSVPDADHATILASVIGNSVTNVLTACGEEFGPLPTELIEKVFSIVLDMGRPVDIQ